MKTTKEEKQSVRAKTLNGPIAPELLLADRKLTISQKMVWLSIRNREGKNDKAWPSLEVICADIGMFRRTVIRAVKALEKAGWLKVSRNSGKVSTYECWIPLVDSSIPVSSDSTSAISDTLTNTTVCSYLYKPIKTKDNPINFSGDKSKLTHISASLDRVRRNLTARGVLGNRGGPKGPGGVRVGAAHGGRKGRRPHGR